LKVALPLVVELEKMLIVPNVIVGPASVHAATACPWNSGQMSKSISDMPDPAM
jgi:hypothetical protein